MASDTRKSKRKTAYNNNFLEALRDLGGGLVDSTVDLGGGLIKDAFDQVSGRQTGGELQPDQALDLQKARSETQTEDLNRQSREFYQDYLDIRKEERLIYSRVEQETKLQVAAVLEELKKLALSTKNLAKEVEVAAHQVPVNPGSYHLNFFEKLRETLILLKKRIDESATWLSAFNQRSKRRNYYWNQFKKSGSKFLLSQERYMSTQAG